MRFDAALLEEYRALLQTTGLQKAYGEFVGMFRWLRAELERQMPDFRFQTAVSGSAVDYACFTFTDEALRQKGLKLAVVFDAAGFQLEVWLCGVNRPAGRRWAGALKDCPPPIQWAGEHPADWLARLPVQADLADGDAAAAAVKEAARQLLDLCARRL